MEVHDKIRIIRETRQLSQEEMANQMNMSISGYAKIERGKTRLHLDKLQQIAEILGISSMELLDTSDKAILFFMNENSDNLQQANSLNYYAGGDEQMATEMEKLKLTIRHQEELLQQKEQELQTLRDVLAILKQEKV